MKKVCDSTQVKCAIAMKYLNETLYDISKFLPRYCNSYCQQYQKLPLPDGNSLKDLERSLIPEDIKYWVRYFCEYDIKKEGKPLNDWSYGASTKLFITAIKYRAEQLSNFIIRPNSVLKSSSDNIQRVVPCRIAEKLLARTFNYYKQMANELPLDRQRDDYERLLLIMIDILSIARRNGILAVRESSLNYIIYEDFDVFWLLGMYVMRLANGYEIQEKSMRIIYRELVRGLPNDQKMAVSLVRDFSVCLKTGQAELAFIERAVKKLPLQRKVGIIEFAQRVIPSYQHG
ncbi:hypothetical protein [Pelosinus sp. sgz500959]|uniref:hypothetical protein n=1 Tax=Pelosinus sp. sgz500959 TaxID=3242472 RepID=UPI00366EBA5D